jgi:uncharacterized protein YuzE
MEGVAAINDGYRTGDLGPWRRHVERAFEPDVVLETGTATFTEGEWHGHEGVVGFVANQMEVLTGMWMRADEFIELDEDRFVVGITFGGKARHTGIDVELTPFHVFDVRAGRIWRWRIFQTRSEALEAAEQRSD